MAAESCLTFCDSEARSGHHLHSHFCHATGVILNRMYFLTGIPSLQGSGDGSGIDDGIIEQRSAGVSLDRFHVIGGAEINGFPGLPHQVNEVGLDRGRLFDRLRDSLHQQVRNDAGEQRTWSERNEVGVRESVQSFRDRFGIPPAESEFDRLPFCLLMRLSPAMTFPSTRSASRTTLVAVQGRCGRNSRGLPRTVDGLGEIAGQVSQGGQEKIPKAVALQAAAR